LQGDKWHYPKIWGQKRIGNRGFIALKPKLTNLQQYIGKKYKML
jgi:hypothetical protein